MEHWEGCVILFNKSSAVFHIIFFLLSISKLTTLLNFCRYECSDCNYKTGDHNTYRRHRMRHTGQRQYKCPFCSYESIQSSTYKSHLKKKHDPADVAKVLFNCKSCKFETLEEGKYTSHVSSCNKAVSSEKQATA